MNRFSIPFILLVFSTLLLSSQSGWAGEADLTVELRTEAPVLELKLPQLWTMTLKNLGPSTANSVTLTFDMVGPLEVLSVDPADSCEVRPIPGGQEWVCGLGSIAPGDSAMVTWQVQSWDVGPPLELSWIGSNSQTDPDSSNNEGHRTIPLLDRLAFDLRLTGSVSPEVLPMSLDTGGHRLNISNLGPDTAFGVTVTDSLPSGWNIVEIQVEGLVVTSTIVGSVASFAIDSIPRGASGIIFVGFEPSSAGWASINSNIQGYGTELDALNNNRLDSVLVLPPPDFIVNTTDDTDDGVCDSLHCSLREAVRMAGRTGIFGGGIIAFRIPGAAPHVIQPLTPYEYVKNNVTFDGWYQPGFSGTPLVEVDGSGIGDPSAYGLAFRTGADSSLVRGLAIGGFPVDAISLGTDSIAVEGCYLGLRTDGVTPLPNGRGITGGMIGSRIGGPTPWQRNVISGNSNIGIWVVGSGYGGRIIGNYIGTDATGTIAVPNSAGILINGGGGLWVGGLDPTEGNLISGNETPQTLSGYGINASGTVDSTLNFANNLIGCDATGQAALPNQGSGILVRGGGPVTGQPLYRIGLPGAGNVVSGNANNGIEVGSAATVVLANLVGVTADGTTSLPNVLWGLKFTGGFGRIGQPGAGNVFGPNNGVAIAMTAGADACTLQSNFVGIDPTGSFEYGGGMVSFNGADDLLLGGSGPGEGNVFYKVQMTGGSNVVIQGNNFGVHGDGVTPFSTPANIAVILSGANIQVGGGNPGEGNVIGGASSVGLWISGGPGIFVEGNWIGVAPDGSSPIPNGIGLRLSSVFQDRIGGPGLGNHIAFNTSTGILATGGGYSDIEITDNTIHDNEGDGIWLDHYGGIYGGPYGRIKIQQNSIFSNTELGIDLGMDGVDPIDNLDTDTGDNGLQNSPTMVSATLQGDSLAVSLILSSYPDADFRIELFLNSKCNHTATGEGEFYFAGVDVRTLASGGGYANVTLPLTDTSRPFITATATDTLGQTSEFSNCLTITGISSVGGELPAPLRDRLLAPYPNPFNPRTTIQWEQARDASAELSIYDLGGRKLATLKQGRKPAGHHTAIWYGRDDRGLAVSSGVYLLRLRLDGTEVGFARKLVLLR